MGGEALKAEPGRPAAASAQVGGREPRRLAPRGAAARTWSSRAGLQAWAGADHAFLCPGGATAPCMQQALNTFLFCEL